MNTMFGRLVPGVADDDGPVPADVDVDEPGAEELELLLHDAATKTLAAAIRMTPLRRRDLDLGPCSRGRTTRVSMLRVSVLRAPSVTVKLYGERGRANARPTAFVGGIRVVHPRAVGVTWLGAAAVRPASPALDRARPAARSGLLGRSRL
jgi:hypothetical protein